MTLSKKNWILLIASVVIALALLAEGIYYFSRFKQNIAIESSELFPAIPEQAACIIRTTSLEKIHSLLSELAKRNNHTGLLFDSMMDEVSALDSVTSLFPQLESKVFKQDLLISWHLQGDSKLKMFSVVHFPTLKEKSYVEQLVKNSTKKSDVRLYNEYPIYHIGRTKKMYVSFWKHYCLMGVSQLIVEQSILKLNSGESIAADSVFSKVLHSAGNDVDMNLFIHFSNLQKVLNKHVQSGALAAQVYKWGTWGGYDLTYGDDGIALRGFSDYNDKSLLNLFKGQAVSEFKMIHQLPANVDCLLGFPLSNYKDYLYNYRNRLDQFGGKTDFSERNNRFQSILGMSTTNFVKTHFSGELAFVILGRSVGDVDDDKVYAMSVKSGEQISSLFERCLPKIDKGLKSSIILDQDVQYPCYQLGKLDVFGAIGGSLFNMSPNSYYVVFNNLLLCSSNKARLKEFIYQNMLKKTFNLSKSYEIQKENLSQQSNLYFFARTSKSAQFLNDFFRSDYGKVVAKKNNLSGVFSGISGTIDLNSPMAYTSIFINYQQQGEQEAQTVWQSRIDDKMDFKPHFLTNHITAEREILIQDVNNVLYLINSVGRVLWKKPLDGRIVGDVTQVDFYKNGKLQMWFATPGVLHLMDRNGNYLDRYPVKFSSKATNGLAVFDYNENRNYRGFIACEDRRVYVYSLDGNRVSGWSFGKTERKVTTPVQWIQNQGKDYLIFGDDYRTYILDRKGNERIKPKALTPKAYRSQFYLDESTSAPCFLTTTPQGEILRIFMDGKVLLSKMEVGTFSSNHFFDYTDISADGRKDFIFADENKLAVFDPKGKSIFQLSTPTKISYPPVIYTFGANFLEVGIVNKKEGLIRLYNKKGKLHKGFPLQGQTMFSIGQIGSGSGKYSLVVGGNNNYLYNYSID